jgi:predicted peptidase
MRPNQLMKILFKISILTGCFFLFSCPSPPEPILEMTGYKYFVVLPENYAQQQTYPLILFLHGAGCGSDDFKVFKSWGLGDYADSTANFPFVVVAPQTQENWYPPLLSNVIDQVCRNYSIDSTRIYVTGFSMGGYGTYNLALAYPKRFAAIVPVCGYGFLDRACEMAQLPVWLFHNEGDPTVESQYSHAMIDSLLKCGALEVRSTFYLETTHNAWTAAYHNPELYSWLLSHVKK